MPAKPGDSSRESNSPPFPLAVLYSVGGAGSISFDLGFQYRAAVPYGTQTECRHCRPGNSTSSRDGKEQSFRALRHPEDSMSRMRRGRRGDNNVSIYFNVDVCRDGCEARLRSQMASSSSRIRWTSSEVFSCEVVTLRETTEVSSEVSDWISIIIMLIVASYLVACLLIKNINATTTYITSRHVTSFAQQCTLYIEANKI